MAWADMIDERPNSLCARFEGARFRCQGGIYKEYIFDISLNKCKSHLLINKSWGARHTKRYYGDLNVYFQGEKRLTLELNLVKSSVNQKRGPFPSSREVWLSHRDILLITDDHRGPAERMNELDLNTNSKFYKLFKKNNLPFDEEYFDDYDEEYTALIYIQYCKMVK